MKREISLRNDKQENPLETKPSWSLLPAYAIPSIVGLLGAAIYNITDQIFIGNIVGLYGNAATNVAFPLVMLVTAFSVLIGL
jgi:Na+-driven multidrug efflux pump